MDIAIIETVGVGQTELDINKISDSVVVTLVPEAGDSIQAMKAGLMEIGDIFIVNKADRGGAEKLAREIDYMVSLKQGSTQWKTKVLTAQAENDIGVDELVTEIISFREYEESSGLLIKKRNKRKISELNTLVEKRLRNELEKTKETATFKDLEFLLIGIVITSSAALKTSSGTPALSRPTRIQSSSLKLKSEYFIFPFVDKRIILLPLLSFR